jgi:hypothetical protein
MREELGKTEPLHPRVRDGRWISREQRTVLDRGRCFEHVRRQLPVTCVRGLEQAHVTG